MLKWLQKELDDIYDTFTSIYQIAQPYEYT